MPSKRHEEVSGLFSAACEMAPDARAAFLEEACAGDAELRAEVEALLAQDEQHPSFLEHPARREKEATPGRKTHTGQQAQPPATAKMDRTRDPEQIGPYRILEKVGEGGMGAVYVAEQREPVRRKVALKIIKLGMDTKQVLARFEVEHHALTIMNHPNIARVYDAGATPEGRPYFVMEHVPGIPINDYCDRHLLNTRQRLELFIPVCHAVQHAHQKSVIHRDLKPSNVLVMMQDGKPVPKIIDFGVAKATGQRLTERTLHTEIGQVIGTPEYMSPEQAEMTAIDIDTRTDIYSLGVILYELLVGAMPFDPKSLRQAGYAEIQRIIREVEPPKLSTRLSSLGDESTIVAQKRHTDRASLRRQLRGDLDWITMRAMDKDRTRRYETANGLAADVQRHLDDEPVAAGPPGTGYRLSKFVRRNRTGVITGLVVIAVSIIGAVVSINYAIGEARQRQIAEQARDEAQRQLKMTQSINDFLNHDLLAAVAPEQQGKDVLMRDVLDTASKAIEGKFDDAPLIEASIRTTLGTTYLKLGHFRKAEPHLVRGLEIRRVGRGEEHPSTLYSMNILGNLYSNQGRYDEAEPLFVKTLEVRRRVLGEEHRDTLVSMHSLAHLYRSQGRYDEAEPLLVKTLKVMRRVLGEEDPDTLGSMNNLAILYKNQARFDEAEPLFVETLELKRRVLGEEHPSTLRSMNNLAELYRHQGRFNEAEPLYVETLEVRRRVLGQEHRGTLRSMNNLANLYYQKGRFDEAESLWVKTLELRRRVLGEEHPETLGSMGNLGILYKNQGRFDEAEPLFVKTLELMRRVLGEEHPTTQQTRNNLLELFKATGNLDQARPLAAEVLASYRKRADGPNASANAMNRYAWELLTCVMHDLRDPVTALEFAKKAVEASNEQNPNILDTLALAEQMTGDIDAAIETATKAVAALGPGPSVLRGELESNLVKYLLEGQRFAKAEPLLLAMHEQLVESSEESSSKTQVSIERLAKFYESWHTAEPGQGHDAKAAEWRAKLP